MAPSTSPTSHEVVIVGAARTPIGSFGGSLSTTPAPALAATAIKGALTRAGVPSSDVDTCYMGHVLTAAVGQAPVRQAALQAGLPTSCVCTAVNKVCASGLKAVLIAAQAIALGDAHVVVAGGMENMSLVPFYSPNIRFTPKRLGNLSMLDGILQDGLKDSSDSERLHMGNCAELCAKVHNISREVQDDYAKTSYQRAQNAWENGLFIPEIEPVSVLSDLSRSAESSVVKKDEEPFRHNVSKIPEMSPTFVRDGTGTVTSGNASGLNDGAAAIVMMSAEEAERRGCKILGRIRGYGDAEQEPHFFTTAPVTAIGKALARAGMDKRHVDVWEINEAFAVMARANVDLLDLNDEDVNLWGGAVALGHPIGCSGARILVTLLSILEWKKASCGVAAVCNGGGGATAIVVER